mmetsp:Transcript_22408/g.35863  ORF Transcript_22408/g.35863 Transcript_22408/m.35863 type:complete len:320 (-) Transcript_22408:364-1323(-)|eukprot:CAMPEP_0197074376 /NCGR_PEP_ID=MMETSP1384-20130603/211079_1 /TAXON_ID=29189 /ORGANISM="Ammonia sp." /LENGTH=319 /DNA_ID=CAMNT_0042513217 /DNA_START=39 /DNA_END=998 /DNA_ORIENTATION=-
MIDTPEFHPGYAALLLVFLAMCASLFKPKDNYHPLQLKMFETQRGIFCLARLQYWTIRFIFYYAIPHVAIGLYLLTITLSIVISVSRVNRDFHANLTLLKHGPYDEFCQSTDGPLLNDIQSIAQNSISWSNQLTWLLIAYFFQKLFSSTLLINAGGSAMIGAVVFDPWLFISTFWGTNIENRWLATIRSEEMSDCISQLDTDHMVFNAMESVLYTVNNINICLWVMCAMSLSAGLVIDIVCTFVREFEYCLKPNLTEEDSMWTRCTKPITHSVKKVDDMVEEAVENAGIKEESSEDEKEQEHALPDGNDQVELEIQAVR